jgi:hypothetical protein
MKVRIILFNGASLIYEREPAPTSHTLEER